MNDVEPQARLSLAQEGEEVADGACALADGDRMVESFSDIGFPPLDTGWEICAEGKVSGDRR